LTLCVLFQSHILNHLYQQENNLAVQFRHDKEGLTNGKIKLETALKKAQSDLDQQLGAIKMIKKIERKYT